MPKTAPALDKTNDSSKSSSSNSEPARKMRVTLLIPETVDKTVELCALIEEKPKSEIVTSALTLYLTGKGYKPNKMPRAQVKDLVS